MPSRELKMLRLEIEKALERVIAAGPTSLVGANPDFEALEDELTGTRLARFWRRQLDLVNGVTNAKYLKAS